MKVNYFIFSFIISFFLTAQTRVNFENHLDVGSRWLERKFFNAFYAGQYLDSTLKHRTLQNLGTFNTVGAYEFSRFELSFPLKDSSSLYIALSHQLGASLQFNKNLFELIFIGNKSFTDSAFTFNSTALYFNHIMSLGSGLIFRKGSFFLETGGLLSLIFNASSADFSRTRLAFSTNHDTISARIDGFTEFPLSKAAIKGVGLGLDISLFWDNMSEQAGVSIFNFGPAFLFKQAKTHYFDTSLTFYGFTYDDLTAFINGEDSLPSSLNDILTIRGDTGLKVKLLPFMLHGFFQQKLYNGLFKVQMLYTPIPSFIPRISIAYSLQPFRWFWVGPLVRYGGFNNFTAGISSNISFHDKLSINLTLPALSQLFGSSYLGYCLTIGLQYKLK